MARPALAATRAVDVLDFLSAHPDSSFTLSEIARALGISLASALSVLQALTDADYLVRHPRHKTYELGPALVAVGQAALLRHRVVDQARSEMRALAAQLDTEVVASVVIRDQIVILATEGRPSLQAADIRIGQRLPLVPPLGQVFLAWSEAADVDAWVDRLPGGLPADARQHLDDALASVRRRGYSVSVDSAARRDLGAAVARLADAPKNRDVRLAVAELVANLGEDYELLDPQRTTTYRIATIAAPIFDATGRVALALTLNGPHRMKGHQAVEHAERLGAACRLVTKRTGGREPTPGALPPHLT